MKLPELGWQILAGVGLVYLYACIEKLTKDPWLSIMFFGYAIAQIGVVGKALGK